MNSILSNTITFIPNVLTNSFWTAIEMPVNYELNSNQFKFSGIPHAYEFNTDLHDHSSFSEWKHVFRLSIGIVRQGKISFLLIQEYLFVILDLCMHLYCMFT